MEITLKSKFHDAITSSLKDKNSEKLIKCLAEGSFRRMSKRIEDMHLSRMLKKLLTNQRIES